MLSALTCRASATSGAAPKNAPNKLAQRGALMLELMVVIFIGLLLVVWGSSEWVASARSLQAKSLGVWMDGARKGMDEFLRQNSPEIARAAAPGALATAGFANWAAPSWQELRAAGYLPAIWSPIGPMGYELNLRLSKDSSCPGAPCDILATISTHKPLLDRRGRLDEAMVAEWLLAAGGKGLVVWPKNPQQLSGAGLNIDLDPGAAEVMPPGTLAMAAVVNTPPQEADEEPPPEPELDLSPFLRLGDNRNPNFTGALTVAGSSTVAGTLKVDGAMELGNSLLLKKTASFGQVCSPSGALVRAAQEASVFICHNGAWARLGTGATAGFGGGYLINSNNSCISPNLVTKACTCPAGAEQLLMAEYTQSTNGVFTKKYKSYLCVLP